MKYKYYVIRSERKNISVSISTRNKITVRCPWHVSVKDIEAFLDSKEKWIERTVTKNSVRLAKNDDIICLRSVYVGGVKKKLVICDKNEICEDEVRVKDISCLYGLFKETFFDGFLTKLKSIADSAKLFPADISVKDYKSRWGCCDGSNNLIFNFRLFMLPERLQIYVGVHELCHTICHNHSTAFWSLVGECLPDYKALEKELHEYDFICSLYG